MHISQVTQPAHAVCLDCQIKFIGRLIDLGTWLELHTILNPTHQVKIITEEGRC